MNSNRVETYNSIPVQLGDRLNFTEIVDIYIFLDLEKPLEKEKPLALFKASTKSPSSLILDGEKCLKSKQGSSLFNKI